MATLTSTLLLLHIVSGFLALVTGFLSMGNRKGGRRHRLTGKLFFAGMTGVFLTATALSLVKQIPFLFMVGFFSYFLACSGYRALYRKQAHLGQKAKGLDWLISGSGVLFGLGLLLFSLGWFQQRGAWGLVPFTFGSVCLAHGLMDIWGYFVRPGDKQHWLLTHGARMGGSFAAALTAFIVVNFSLGSFTWVLWILPGLLVGVWIGRLLKPYKRKKKQETPALPAEAIR
ncbi:hypothetical protein V9K67_09430 [Paraflavisolibacter sp. H34]|uniref:hypothetical protein n=1 Tax=Huijunlia imazamoxiresistens TaxID=3127457 RepID=UPI003018F933